MFAARNLLLTPTRRLIAFDAVAAGNHGATATLTWSHTAVAGAYVVVPVIWLSNPTISSITYAGTAMTLLGSQFTNNSSANGCLALYGLAGVAGGAQTVTVTLSSAVNASADSVSYTGVSSAGSPTYNFGSGSPLSQSATCTPGQMIVQAFGQNGTTAFSSPTGGTNRVLIQQASARLSISDSTSSTTFGVTGGGTANGAGVAIILS